MLLAENISKSYRKRQVVQSVNLSLAEGEILGLLGPNGAGKTTCFYMLLGLVPTDSGKIYLDQKDVTRLPLHARAHLGMGYLAQEPSIFRKLSVKDNILAILESIPNLDKKTRLTRCDALLEEFRIGHVKDTLGMRLSGGERRRVEIARTLASNPRIILLDEPFAGIDPISIIDIKHIIETLAKEKNIAILITDHNVRETLKICDRACIMNEGKVLVQGKPNDVLANQQVREVYLGEEFSL